MKKIAGLILALFAAGIIGATALASAANVGILANGNSDNDGNAQGESSGYCSMNRHMMQYQYNDTDDRECHENELRYQYDWDRCSNENCTGECLEYLHQFSWDYDQDGNCTGDCPELQHQNQFRCSAE
ncbi:MAG: hypothetical protein OEV21_06720 [Thermoplasmata archaeon]|nr:hypothetical protein [Thermoplasmata archaeon]